MRQGIVVAVAGLACVVGLALMLLTTPSSAGPLGGLALFICIYIVVAALVYGVLRLLLQALFCVAPSGNMRRAVEAMPAWKLYYLASVIGLAPVILLGMQSIGGIKLLDVSLLIIFEIIACFYIIKRF